MDQRRDAQPRCRGSRSLCALGRVGGGVAQQKGQVPATAGRKARPLPSGRPAPTRRSLRGGTPFSGCDRPGAHLSKQNSAKGASRPFQAEPQAPGLRRWSPVLAVFELFRGQAVRSQPPAVSGGFIPPPRARSSLAPPLGCGSGPRGDSGRLGPS